MDSLEYEIPFEQVGVSKVVGVYVSNSALLSGLICLAIAGWAFFLDGTQVFLGFGSVGLVAFCYGLFTRTGKVSVASTGGVPIELFFSRGSKLEAEKFADALIAQTKVFMREKYAKFDKRMPLQPQFETLDFLRTRGAITFEEYEQYKEELLGSEKPSIGFISGRRQNP